MRGLLATSWAEKGCTKVDKAKRAKCILAAFALLRKVMILVFNTCFVLCRFVGTILFGRTDRYCDFI